MNNRGSQPGDLKHPRWMYLKGFLLLTGGLLAGALLLCEAPTLKVAFLLGVCIWCFARAYYFAFYVIQHYIDDQYKFAGLWSFVKYLWRERNSRPG